MLRDSEDLATGRQIVDEKTLYDDLINQKLNYDAVRPTAI